jgi:hypothetical protein
VRASTSIIRESPLALESAADYLATQLHHAEQALRDGRPFLVGGRSTTTDMLLATCLSWAVSYRLAGDSGLPRLHGEDHIPADLPCQCCGQQAEGGTAGSARRLLLGDTASGWEIAIQREMSQVFGSGAAKKVNLLRHNRLAAFRATITGSKSLPQRSCMCSRGRPFLPDMRTSPQCTIDMAIG